MKKILAVLLVTFMFAGGTIAGEIEDLRSDYKQVVDAFAQNAVTLNLLVEGFKSTNPTFKRILAEQVELQGMANKLAVRIGELEKPPVEPDE